MTVMVPLDQSGAPKCPACRKHLVLTLVGSALGEALRVSQDQGIAVHGMEGMFVDWAETDIEMEPVNLECTECAFRVPWESAQLSWEGMR